MKDGLHLQSCHRQASSAGYGRKCLRQTRVEDYVGEHFVVGALAREYARHFAQWDGHGTYHEIHNGQHDNAQD